MDTQEADDKAHEADLAGVLGEFEDYWQREGQAAQARLEAEYERARGQEPSGGDSQEGG
jgi:hypothetical protein